MLKIVEKFHSIQSEGKYAGHAATFLRVYGCNRSCEFSKGHKCDEPLHTVKSSIVETSYEELVTYCKGIKHVVITGGEPSLYALNELITLLQEAGHRVAVETNGFHYNNIAKADHITYSPKHTFLGGNDNITMKYGFHELKLLAGVDNPVDVEAWSSVKEKYVQPIAFGEKLDLENIKWCHDFVVANPDWKLSLQSHKLYGAD